MCWCVKDRDRYVLLEGNANKLSDPQTVAVQIVDEFVKASRKFIIIIDALRHAANHCQV